LDVVRPVGGRIVPAARVLARHGGVARRRRPAGRGDGRARAVTATPSRNAPCPCGSGKRYKECHGAFATPAVAPEGANVLERLAQARSALERNDHAAARAICDDVLREAPDHPYALDLRAQVEAASG